MARKKLSLEDDMIEVLRTLSEGNPGALSVLIEVLNGDLEGLSDIHILDDMNIRGPQIWVAYKDVCKQDISNFREKIRNRDMDMVHQVNQEMLMDPTWKELAVRSKR